MGLLMLYRPQRKVVAETSPYSFPALQTIDLEVGKKEMKALRRRRDHALALGILQEDDSSWVKAMLHEGKQAFPVEIRLKGDWVDHLEGEKWSFRVELQDDMAWRGIKEFSLQSPERRGNLDEWLFHKVLAREGVLSPRYDFVYLQLNGKDLGPYAVEEHFSKELLESQHHRQGPILKFDEAGMWDARVAALQDSAFPYLQIPFQDAATVLPFKQKRTLRDTVLADQFRIANQLMWQYRYGLRPPREIFDLDLVARQYALTDLFQAYHGMIWHNRRYYYNPVTSKLEPIVFDAFSGEANDTYIDGPIWGHQVDGWHPVGDYHDVVGDMFFRDEDFLRAYYGSLLRYCASAYLDSVLYDFQDAIGDREVFLNGGADRSRLDESRWVQNGEAILGLLLQNAQTKHLRIISEPWPDGGSVFRVQNPTPYPIEVWVAGKFTTTRQVLAPTVPNIEPCFGYFSAKSQASIRCRVPQIEDPDDFVYEAF